MFVNDSQESIRYLFKARKALEQGDFAAAKAHAESVLNLNPSPSYEALNILGICFVEYKEYIEALACFDASLIIQPKQTEARLNRAKALVLLGKRLNLKPLDTGAFGEETLGCAIFVRGDDKND